MFNYMHCVFLHFTEYCFLVYTMMWLVAHPSKYSSARTGDTRYRGLQLVLHNWRLTGVVKQGKFCGAESFILQVTFKFFIAFYEILRLKIVLVDYILIELISVRTTVTQVTSSSTILIIFSRTYTSTPTALHLLVYKCGDVYFSLVQGHTFQFIFFMRNSEVTFFKILRKCSYMLCDILFK